VTYHVDLGEFRETGDLLSAQRGWQSGRRHVEGREAVPFAPGIGVFEEQFFVKYQS